MENKKITKALSVPHRNTQKKAGSFVAQVSRRGAGKLRNQQITFVTRQHWLILLGQILAKSVLALGLVILITLIWRIWLPHALVPRAYLLLILPLLGLLRDVIIWTSRQYIVTDWRVIQISGVFSKEVTDSSLEKVNDVKLEQSFGGRLLDYGDLEILTASELGVNRFTHVGQPIRLKTAMLNAKEIRDIDELRFITGFDIIPYVITELRLLYALEKYYGISGM